MTRACALLGSTLALALLLPRAARAESAAIACAYTTPEVTPPAGSIPANTALFALGIRGAAVHWSEITLTRTRDGHAVPLVFWEVETWGQSPSFSPTETLEVGATYVLQHPACVGMATRSTTYQVTDPIPGPASLGTITVRGPFVSTFGQHGDCHAAVFHALVLAVDPAFASEPWSHFEWGIDVDGGGITGTLASVATTTVPVFVDCGSGAGVAPGSHRVGASAFPTTTTRTAWAPFGTADVDATFSCDNPTWVDFMTLAPLSPAAIASWRADPMGTCTMDGGVRPSFDAAVDGAAHTEPDTRPNCGCTSARRGAPTGLAWLALAALASVRSRRARRRMR